MNFFYKILILLTLCCLPSAAYALEGDWEAGGLGLAYLQPGRDIYGGGAELFARYAVTDGFSLSAGAAAYGVRSQKYNKSFGLYTLRIGGVYALDILQWVPSVGVHFSSQFSENRDYSWHRGGKGLGIDFGAQIQYRGIRGSEGPEDESEHKLFRSKEMGVLPFRHDFGRDQRRRKRTDPADRGR